MAEEDRPAKRGKDFWATQVGLIVERSAESELRELIAVGSGVERGRNTELVRTGVIQQVPCETPSLG